MPVGVFRHRTRYAPIRIKQRRWGLTYPATSGTISLSSPTDHACFQREGIGAGLGKADIPIIGTYTGSPSAIEARWNGGSYATVVSSPTGGSFNTKLSRQVVGSGTLDVRFANDHSITASATAVKVGDVYIIIGQSNPSGRGTNPQSYTGTAGWGSMYRSGWATLADPVGIEVASAGSVWPLLGNSIVGSGLVPVGFINVAVGGTSITEWQPGGGNFATATAALVASGNKIARAALWWQGETDALAPMATATYLGYLRTLSAGARASWGCKVVPCKLQNSSGISDGDEALINAAIDQDWAQDQYTEAGPDLTDMPSDDAYHLMTDAHLLTAAGRWYTALAGLYYVASAGGGAVPTINGSPLIRGAS